MKLRFHRGDSRDDVRALGAVRARVSGRLELRMDCDQGWCVPWDTHLLEFPFDPPEWSLARRDYMLAAPLTAAAQGWINLPEAPGMGCVLDDGRLRATRSAARA